jgi:FixJ family two-component response regulator
MMRCFVVNGTIESSPPNIGNEPVVYVIDDDASVRKSLAQLFRSVDLHVEVFTSATELLQRSLPSVPSCLVIDVRLPGLSGFELHTELTKSDIRVPIVFITAHGDIPMSVRAMKGGAIDFLTKPVRDQDMLDAVTTAISRDRSRLEAESVLSALRDLFKGLTPREQEVMTLVSSGLMNKHIAAEVGLSEITVKIHRGHVMKKMKAKSLADLVKMAEALGLKRAKA